MKINKKKIFAGLGSLLLSIFIFIFMFELISYIKYTESSKIDTVFTNLSSKDNKTIPLSNNINEHFDYIKCKEKDIMAECSEVEKHSEKKEDLSINQYIWFKDLSNSLLIIKVIYIFLIYSLAQQIYIFCLTLSGYKLDISYFHKSEWSINVAPMFGLLGTFFAIAISLNNNGNLDEVLTENFFDAVMTTIIGIVFYTINFYLKIYIYPKIDSK